MFPVCQAILEFICCIFLTLELLFDSGTLFSLVIVSNQPDWFVAAEKVFSGARRMIVEKKHGETDGRLYFTGSSAFAGDDYTFKVSGTRSHV